MNRLGAKQAAGMIERGELTAEKLIRACLERIAERAKDVKAWTYVSTAVPKAVRAPMFGVPVGVKDIFDTADMPTEYGSRIYAGHRPRVDSAPVAMTRHAGGTILGKTVTAEFATFVPGETRNPHNLAHTPGGSSSGSAAAVADFQVPLAFGTQTAGSVIRPGAYCGIVACKPTYGLIACSGVKAGADSLDTVGVYGRSVEDVVFFLSCLSGLSLEASCESPKIGMVHPGVDPVERCGRILEAREVKFPQWQALLDAHRDVLWYEIARSLGGEYDGFPDLMDSALRERCTAGWAMDAKVYERAVAVARRARTELDALFGDNDVLVAPAATGEAPKGLHSTGDVSMNTVWTLLHVPCVSVPAGKGPNGLPLGLQVIGRIGDDARTLACARWIESKLKGMN